VVVPGIASLLESARDSAGDLASRADATSSNLAASASDVADRAMTTTSNVARDTLASLFWLLAASGVIYFAFLSAERRERVKRLLYTSMEQARLLIRDFQGYEEDL